MTLVTSPGSRYGWVWSLLVILLADLAGLVYVLPVPAEVRNLVIVVFVAIGPGLALVMGLRLDGLFPVFPAAFMMSMTIILLAGLALLYTGQWSPDVGILVLIAISLLGAAVRLFRDYARYLRALRRK